MLIASSGVVSQVQAVLPGNAILQFDPGVRGGYYNFVLSGSYFAMDTNGDSTFQKSERTPIIQNAGVSINKAQSASGTHSGAPDGSESPGLDQPWNFFGNTGLHQTTSPVLINSSTATTTTLDFSGWNVAWNGIDSIPMGNGPSNGEATISCTVDCADGDTYTLDYFATVPLNDPSGFGGVPYNLHLEGTVFVPPSFTASSGVSASGSIASAVGSPDGRITMADVISNGGIDDPGFTYAGGLLDFVVSGIAGSSVAVVIPQTTPVPAGAVYRKLIGGAWVDFITDANNSVASAPSVAGVCPVPNDAAYNPANGLVAGHDCVQLVIQDGGSYDAHPAAGTIADPGGVATPVQTQVDTRTSSTSGCSITGGSNKVTDHADWWLVAAFIGILGWLRSRCDRGSDGA